jgi:hypothetical protein
MDLDQLSWVPVSRDEITARINDPALREFFFRIEPRIDIASTPTRIYLKRRDGRVIVQPKDGSQAFCYDCHTRLKHLSPAAFAEKTDFDTGKKYFVPYCVNEDRCDQVD